MDRRLFVTGLLGVVGTTGIATVLTGRAEALAAVPPGDLAPQSDALPKLPESDGPLGEVDGGWELDEDWDPEAGEELYEGFELAHVRRRRRRRRWRRICRRYWHYGYWRRRCRRRPFWIWIWI